VNGGTVSATGVVSSAPSLSVHNGTLTASSATVPVGVNTVEELISV
jgi:hypothetical protein